MNAELLDVIKSKNREIQPLLFAHYVQKIFELRRDHILAVMAYGSFVNELTKSSTSTPDFYVVVDDYNAFYNNSWHSFLNRHLPPNIYHLETSQGHCKYCVISMKGLEKETGRKAKDIYQAGRFSKRMGLIWTKSPEVEHQIVEAQASALHFIAQKVLLALDEPVSLDEFVHRALRISYQGDIRIESDNKIEKIWSAEKEYYQRIYSLVLENLSVQKNADGMYFVPRSPMRKLFDQLRFNKFIYKSKIRSQGHWPKNILTADRWLDYVLAKIERTQGIKIELTETERKYWYIFGWKYFVMLSRKKLIK